MLAGGETGTWNAGAAPAYAEVRILDRPAPASNLLLAIGLVLLVPALYVGLGYRFEVKRWDQSDFSPYEKHT